MAFEDQESGIGSHVALRTRALRWHEVRALRARAAWGIAERP